MGDASSVRRVGREQHEFRGWRRAASLWILLAALAIGSLAACANAGVAVNQPMLKRVYARLDEERTFLSEVGPRSGHAGAVTLAKCYKTDGFVVIQPGLERRWAVPEWQAADAVRSLQSRAEARGWHDDSAGSEIVRLRKQVQGDSLVLEITSESGGGGTTNINLYLYLSNLSPCS